MLLGLLMSVRPNAVHAQTFLESRQQYPIVESDGERVITGFQTFSSDDNKIMANAMKWVIEDACDKERDAFFDININKKTFSYNRVVQYLKAGAVKYTFFYKVNITIAEGKLVYTIYDMQYKGNSIIPLTTTSSINRLNPEKKAKHKEIINALQAIASEELNKMFDAITGNACKPITHWNDISIQRAVKGMNEDECFLAFGKPNSIYEDNNGRLQWSYGLNFVLIFKKDKLETIIR